MELYKKCFDIISSKIIYYIFCILFDQISDAWFDLMSVNISNPVTHAREDMMINLEQIDDKEKKDSKMLPEIQECCCCNANHYGVKQWPCGTLKFAFAHFGTHTVMSQFNA